MFANKLLEVLGRLGCVIERQLREEMMDNMVMGDIMQEHSSLPSKEVPIDSSSSASLEGPFVFAIMGHLWISVMEVGDHDEPVSYFEPGDGVVFENFGCAEEGGRVGYAPGHDEDTDVGGNNCVALGGVEDYGVGIEVVCPFRVVLLSRNVEQEISGESEELLSEQHVHCVNGSIAQNLIIINTLSRFFLWDSKIGTGLRDVDFIFLH